MSYRLNEEQKKAYQEKGYLIGLPPAFDVNEVPELKLGFQELCKLLEPHETPYGIIRWHMSSRWLYDVCTKPQMLDYVEDLLGPNFYLWGIGFFAKAPPNREDGTMASRFLLLADTTASFRFNLACL